LSKHGSLDYRKDAGSGRRLHGAVRDYMARAEIHCIEVYLPQNVLTNEELALEYAGWTAAKIEEKTGIHSRHIAGESECSSDMATAAGLKLFESGCIAPEEIDYVLLCTQSPDYFLPTTACLVQNRLGLRTDCGALDFNLGCSGFVYGLGLAKGLIETEQAKNVLLLTAETYSKFIHPGDKSVRTLFGDAAAATLIRTVQSDKEKIGPFVCGTDGRGAKNLIVPTGGLRSPHVAEAEITEDESGNKRTINNLYMNGAEIFTFTLRAVPEAVNKLLVRSGKTIEDIDLFLFHQANRFMLDHLKRKLCIPDDKLPVMMDYCGNTVSSTIPILLKDLTDSGKIVKDQCLMLVGFGVGYSWAASIVNW
jgi:3-oxoacyl-[acyl-carrier-protein] synthase III